MATAWPSGETSTDRIDDALACSTAAHRHVPSARVHARTVDARPLCAVTSASPSLEKRARWTSSLCPNKCVCARVSRSSKTTTAPAAYAAKRPSGDIVAAPLCSPLSPTTRSRRSAGGTVAPSGGGETDVTSARGMPVTASTSPARPASVDARPPPSAPPAPPTAKCPGAATPAEAPTEAPRFEHTRVGLPGASEGMAPRASTTRGARRRAGGHAPRPSATTLDASDASGSSGASGSATPLDSDSGSAPSAPSAPSLDTAPKASARGASVRSARGSAGSSARVSAEARPAATSSSTPAPRTSTPSVTRIVSNASASDARWAAARRFASRASRRFVSASAAARRDAWDGATPPASIHSLVASGLELSRISSGALSSSYTSSQTKTLRTDNPPPSWTLRTDSNANVLATSPFF